MTFSDPFLNTSGTISLKYHNAKLNVDASGNLTVISSGTSQWTTTGTSIFYNGNVDCGGGLALTGSNAFYNISGVDAGNYSNTYLTFRPSITNNDWCYVRQIGSDNAYKLALDFHDDGNDARFCIRNVQSTNAPDTISEVFIVDNGNVSFTGKLILGNTNVYPDIQLGSTNGNNLGIATAAGAFSTSSAVNDMVIRSINRLIL